jgi:hypothetical protein
MGVASRAFTSAGFSKAKGRQIDALFVGSDPFLRRTPGPSPAPAGLSWRRPFRFARLQLVTVFLQLEQMREELLLFRNSSAFESTFRAGIAWKRERYWERGERVPF